MCSSDPSLLMWATASFPISTRDHKNRETFRVAYLQNNYSSYCEALTHYVPTSLTQKLYLHL